MRFRDSRAKYFRKGFDGSEQPICCAAGPYETSDLVPGTGGKVGRFHIAYDQEGNHFRLYPLAGQATETVEINLPRQAPMQGVSPDGKYLAYCVGRPSPSVRVKDVWGRAAERKWELRGASELVSSGPVWSDDSRYVYVVALDLAAGEGLYQLDCTSGQKRLLWRER